MPFIKQIKKEPYKYQKLPIPIGFDFSKIILKYEISYPSGLQTFMFTNASNCLSYNAQALT